jgi:NADH-quinone oxidoreductase subunit I
MDHVFELSGVDRKMILEKTDLAKPNDYFHKIHPLEAATVDAARAAEQRKAQAKKAAAPVPAAV